MFKNGAKCVFGVAFLWGILIASGVWAFQASTANYVVIAHDPNIATVMAKRAEELRKEMSVLWLGVELPQWSVKCTIKVSINEKKQPYGSTSFTLDNGEVYDWHMFVEGSRDRVYDSVLPHEITHMILASYFRRPVPRWADEGMAAFTESDFERNKYQRILIETLHSDVSIPLNRLFEMTEYPQDPLPLYAQGFSVSEFLIRQRGPKFFVHFVEQCMKGDKTWNTLVYESYRYENLQHLQEDWLNWVKAGSKPFCGSLLVENANEVVVLPNLPTPENPNPVIPGIVPGRQEWTTEREE